MYFYNVLYVALITFNLVHKILELEQVIIIHKYFLLCLDFEKKSLAAMDSLNAKRL
jgi:hypothetical protein